jgi:translation initiation factor 2B subunit (eIF-2B alpha/beta/delta family)
VDRLTAQSIAAIAADTLSGAVEIAEKSAEVFARLARMPEAQNLAWLRHMLVHTGWALIDAHPTMAPLVNLVNTILWKLDTPLEAHAVPRTVLDTIQEFTRRLRVHEAAIAETALRLMPEDCLIVTHGRSTTVRAALRHAQRAGRRFEVICTESRPGYEGRALATDLAASGIAVRLVVDALALVLVQQAQLVMVGADHLTGQGLVNKIGTYGIALAAHAAQVPMYTLCSSEKFLPPGYVPPEVVAWQPDAIWAEASPGVDVLNVLFDTTPTDLLAGVVTEQGVQPHVGIEAWLAATRLHPRLGPQGRG